MYQRLGETVGRHPWVVFCTWAGIAAGLLTWAPSPHQISKDGVFSYLPANSQSLKADNLFREAFPQTKNEAGEYVPMQPDPVGSDVVVVARRNTEGGINDADRAFLYDTLTPRLRELQETTPVGRTAMPDAEFPKIPQDEQRIRAVWNAGNERFGPLMNSPDGQSTLVLVELKGEFLDYGNGLVIWRIEELLKDQELAAKQPEGLKLAISGSATVGRDMLRAEQQSASSTEHWTKALVIGLLLLIYRAPLLALIPLLTVGVAVPVAIRLLTLMAEQGWIGFFAGMNVYVTVVVYGAGVDYCLFIVARLREQLEHGVPYPKAVARSVGFVGAALAASAGTSIFGILMMMAAEFGKFRQAGFAISFGMFIVLICALTLTPALLRLFGPIAFWPFVPRPKLDEAGNLVASEYQPESRWFDRAWGVVARRLEAKPGIIFVTSVLLMMPFAAIAVVQREHLSYGLLSDLPKDAPSVEGASAIQEHFPAGATGVTTMMLRNDQFARDPESGSSGPLSASALMTRHETIAKKLLDNLRPRFEELGIVDIRTQTTPLGLSENAQAHLRRQPVSRRMQARRIQHGSFASTEGPQAGKVLRLDLVFASDPFSRNAISDLAVVENAVFAALPRELRGGTEVLTLGSTAGMRDLKAVTDRDQIRIDLLVMGAVYLVLIMLLRQPAVSAYLVISVAFSYLVTMGATYVFFWAISPGPYAGLDWKVPIFTFTLLIALGEDYNILLMARVTEEQQKHGLVKGVLVALMKTGGIISSCGIIMAGTFCSLMTGTLHGMVQLGFALAFGVLLDTFVVRPVLVPSYLILLYRGRFGRLSGLLGRPRELPVMPPFASPLSDSEPWTDAAAAEGMGVVNAIADARYVAPPVEGPLEGAPVSAPVSADQASEADLSRVKAIRNGIIDSAATAIEMTERLLPGTGGDRASYVPPPHALRQPPGLPTDLYSGKPHRHGQGK